MLTLSLCHSSVPQLREVTQEEVDEVLSHHALKLKLRDVILNTHTQVLLHGGAANGPEHIQKSRDQRTRSSWVPSVSSPDDGVCSLCAHARAHPEEAIEAPDVSTELRQVRHEAETFLVGEQVHQTAGVHTWTAEGGTP